MPALTRHFSPRLAEFPTFNARDFRGPGIRSILLRLTTILTRVSYRAVHIKTSIGRKEMGKCAVCGKDSIGGYGDGDDIYCSLQCYTYSPLGTFCNNCIASTTDESAGNTVAVSLFGIVPVGGDQLTDWGYRCPNCHSIVQRKSTGFANLRYSGKRYRVIYVGKNQYISRRIRS